MFTSLLFLILVLLLITFSPEGVPGVSWSYSPSEALLLGILLYVVTIGMIIFQNLFLKRPLRMRQNTLLNLANVELLIFLIFYHFVLGAFRFFSPLGVETINLIIPLLLYFAGLYIFHVTTFNRHRSYPHVTSYKTHAKREVLLLLPFILPIMLITIISDILYHTLSPEMQHELMSGESVWSYIPVFVVIIILIVNMMIFLPFTIQKMWRCQPLENSPLKERLLELCQRAHFKHAGLKTWTVLDHALTAAIIGIVPRYRYIMFSKRLLKEMPEASVEAVLAHEIGHSYHRHLWIYPFIIFGVSIILSFVSLVLPQSEYAYFPLFTFILYAVVLALYFRIVFGFFSRLFERQADLHVFTLGVPPEHLIDALDHIGVATGNTHKVPNWHHYGIQERIDFIKEAIRDPEVIAAHHRRVKVCVSLYFVILILAIVWLLLS